MTPTPHNCKTAKCRGVTPDDVSHGPISILATTQSASHDGRHWHVLDLQRLLQTRRRKGASAQGGRGRARGNLTRLPRPVTSWSATPRAWRGSSFGSPRPYPTICRHWVASPLRVVRSPVVFLVATLRWPPVRCAAGLVLLWGAEAREDRHLVGLFATRHMLDTLADWWGLQRQCGCIGGLVPGSRGVTPAVHSHGQAPLAPVVSVDRKCARSGELRPRSGPSVLRADQTSGTASPHGSLACLSSQVSRR